MKKRSAFFIFICLVGMGIGIGQWFIYNEMLPNIFDTWTIIFFLLLPVIFTLPNIIKNQLPFALAKLLSVVGGYWLIFFYYSIYLMLIYFLLYLTVYIFGLYEYWQVISAKIIMAGLLLIICLIIKGTWNVFHPVCRRVIIKTDKPIKRDYSMVFVSDIHLGTIIGKSFSQKLTAQINAQVPDMVLFGGDIIDGNLEFVIRDNSSSPFKKITAPLGKYAVYGNHDYFGGSLVKEQSLLKSADIRFLKNESVVLDDCLKITGLDDYIYHPTPIPPVQEDNLFQILMEHEPYQIAAASAAKYDLYLAGHTHAGQFYPDRLVTRRIYALDYGTKLFDKMTAVVSNGYGFWGTPVRLGPPPEIVLIKIEKI